MSPQIQGTVQYTYTSQPPGPSDKDDSTILSQPSVTSDANTSFTRPIAGDSVHSNTILAGEHALNHGEQYLFLNM